jgi:hypothetical protein
MINTHPVEAVFEHLTSIVKHSLPSPVNTHNACSCCKRPASEFGGIGYAGQNGYGVEYVHCAACESFNVGDIKLLGIERNAKTLPNGEQTGVSHKFGMLAGSGAIITAKGAVVLFTPPGTYKKLPESLLKTFTVVEATIADHIGYISKADFDFPLVYISNFGKKTGNLIQGLRWSYSTNAIVSCSDEGNDSMTEELNTFCAESLLKLKAAKLKLKKAEWENFKKQIRRLCTGYCTPVQFSEYLRGTEQFIPLYRLLPVDPHKRLAMLLQVEKVS